MRRGVWAVLKTIIIFFVIALVVILVLLVAKKERTIKEQKSLIGMYEEEFLEQTGETDTTASNTQVYSDEQLAAELETVKQRLSNLEQGTVTTTPEEENVYLNVKFPYDGNYYKEAGDTQYYSDPTCTSKLDTSSLRFRSSNVDSGNAENGLYIFCLRLDNGDIVYCTQSPWLVTESEYMGMYDK